MLNWGLLLGALYSGRTENCFPAVVTWVHLSGAYRTVPASLSALPASLSAAWEVAGAAAERDAGPYVYHPESKAEVPDAGTGYLGSADVGRTRQKDAS